MYINTNIYFLQLLIYIQGKKNMECSRPMSENDMICAKYFANVKVK